MEQAHHIIPDCDEPRIYFELHIQSPKCPCNPTKRDDLTVDGDDQPCYIHNPVQ